MEIKRVQQIEDNENKIKTENKIENKIKNKIEKKSENSKDGSSKIVQDGSWVEDSSFKLADQQACASMTALLKVRILLLYIIIVIILIT